MLSTSKRTSSIHREVKHGWLLLHCTAYNKLGAEIAVFLLLNETYTL